MKKYLLVGILFISIGIGLSLLLDSFLRITIFDLYRWSTNDKIVFFGKGFHLFPSPTFILSFTFSIMLLGFAIINQKLGRIAMNCILYLSIFSIALISISALDANRLVVSCTVCQDGIRRINHNSINYGVILGISSFLASIPSIVNLIKRVKN